MSDGTYGALAPWYDAVMAHVDYPQWASHVESIWKHIGVRPRFILETAAGTLALAPYLKRASRRWVHSDLSLEMLSNARPPALGMSDRVAADFRALPFAPAKFDAVLCLYDAINYCLMEEDLRRFFAEAFRVLKPGGTFIFDHVTSVTCARYFRDFTTHEEVQGTHVVRESSWDPMGRLQHNLFTFFLPDGQGKFVRRQEHHMQKMWPGTLFRRLAEKAGFVWLGAWDDFTLDPVRRNSERVHVALRRPS